MSHTKIPGIASHKRPLQCIDAGNTPLKRANILGDVTNTSILGEQLKSSHLKYAMSSSAIADPNLRLMNRYYYGDPNVIEEVKKRERKIARDIQHFRKSIAEIDTEAKHLRERDLPDLRYEMSKKNAVLNELRKDLIQVTADLDEKANDYESLKANGQLELQHAQLKHQVALQEVQNELDHKISTFKAEWENKLREMENYTPDPEILAEIEGLRRQKLERENQIRQLNLGNEQACQRKKEELAAELEQQLVRKQDTLNELRTKNESAEHDKAVLENEVKSVTSQFAQYEDRCTQLMHQISEINSLVTDCLEDRSQSVNATKNAEAIYLESKAATESVQIEALEVEARYNREYDNMEKEQKRRRVMENSIDELRGRIRCFAFVGDEGSEESTIDYSCKTVSVKRSEPCLFNRIVPRKLVSEKELISQECEPFFRMCMDKQLNFNVMSSPTGKQLLLRETLLEYLIESGNKKLITQYVSLGEGAESRDLFLQADKNEHADIQLTIKKDTIEMNSTILEMRSTQDIKNNLARLEAEVGSENIGILKAEIWEEHTKCCDAYYLEINNLTIVDTLRNVRDNHTVAKSPIAIILQTLLSRTKSLFLFNLFDEHTADPSTILDSVRYISQFEVPRTHLEGGKL
ncbi:LAME_0H14070g1_1 [Lachancea meyersii CBS 8951]|uniref:LAME_0H14070g1_1 n=1 Tax=Lachancea meyersii CBS 8951 TaxID=1266667 RepID=A0A1G4KHE5_9SACH|nr:LAME_0H14070g1_1 [Lachancea meyersii CBS 8951]